MAAMTECYQVGKTVIGGFRISASTIQVVFIEVFGSTTFLAEATIHPFTKSLIAFRPPSSRFRMRLLGVNKVVPNEMVWMSVFTWFRHNTIRIL